MVQVVAPGFAVQVVVFAVFAAISIAVGLRVRTPRQAAQLNTPGSGLLGREAVALELAKYAESDLLCYRAEDPAALVARQAAEWHPWLDWAAERYGARLEVTAGVMHRPQPAAAVAALAAAVAAQTVSALAALGIIVPSTGSLVLGLAVAEGVLDAAGATAASQLDELFQAEQWGVEWESQERRERVASDIALAARYLSLSR